jgi:hypothetical protein
MCATTPKVFSEFPARGFEFDSPFVFLPERKMPMKRTLLIVVFSLASATFALGQAGHGGQENNLRGLKGIRLVVMFGRAGAIEKDEGAAILKTVEADATAKLQTAGIPLFRYADEMEAAGQPLLDVRLTLDKPNGHVYPLVTNVTLYQRVRLTRDSSIEADLATWSQSGIGAPVVTLEMIRQQVGGEIDQFIKDYRAVNPK